MSLLSAARFARLTVLLFVAACSTALSIDPLEADEPGLLSDAAPVDAGRPTTDAGRADAGRPTADAGRVDSGRPVADSGTVPGDAPHDCARLPTRGVASLLTDDCAMRRLIPCAGQAELDKVLANAAAACGATGTPLDLAFTLNGAGCPEQLRYEQARILGAVSVCLQAALEDMRFACRLKCALLSSSELR